MQKRNRTKRIFTFGMACLLLVGTLTLAATASTVSIKPPSVYHTNVGDYVRVPIYLPSGSRLAADGRLISSTTYVPLRAFVSAFMPDASITYREKTRTAAVEGAGLSLEASDGGHVVYANERCLYSDMPVRILSDGTMYVPIRILAKVFSLEVVWNDASRSVSLKGNAVPLLSGSRFYDADTVYWLSRIISAEARGEPFIGQIAVGNVVLNRVKHRDFPNTVWGVIFDRRAGMVQFSPVEDGSIWQTPYSVSVTAAKVCLEGYTVSERILFFYAPSMVTHTWISKNRPYAFTIAGHKFYY